MKKIKYLIIIFIVIIIIIISVILLLKVKDMKDNETMDKEGDIGEVINYEDNNLKVVDDTIKFYTVRDCIYNYYNSINALNNINTKPKIDYNKSNEKTYQINEEAFNDIDLENIEENVNINGQDVVNTDEEIRQNVLDLISREYIKNNGITTENIQRYIENEQRYISYEPLKMKVLAKSKINKYLVYGFLTDDNNDFLEYKYLIVNLDGVNGTFSIEPLNNKYNNIDEIIIENNNEEIGQNSNNRYSDVPINNEFLILQYINIYKKMFTSNPELAYDYLDNDYKNKRFGSLEQYKKYIENNKDELSKLEINKYSVDEVDEFTRYVCKDIYNNNYIIKESDPMEFVLLLDSYTLGSDYFIEEYNNSNNQYKTMINIDKWIRILNNRDYKTAYRYLDETFKENNFNTEEKFEEYMREKIPLHYKVQYNEFSDNNGIYVQEIILKDITEQTEEEESMTVVMQLKENTDFVMSFNIK